MQLQIEDLPLEMLDQVFSYLNTKELLTTRVVSKRFNLVTQMRFFQDQTEKLQTHLIFGLTKNDPTLNTLRAVMMCAVYKNFIGKTLRHKIKFDDNSPIQQQELSLLKAVHSQLLNAYMPGNNATTNIKKSKNEHILLELLLKFIMLDRFEMPINSRFKILISSIDQVIIKKQIANIRDSQYLCDITRKLHNIKIATSAQKLTIPQNTRLSMSLAISVGGIGYIGYVFKGLIQDAWASSAFKSVAFGVGGTVSAFSLLFGVLVANMIIMDCNQTSSKTPNNTDVLAAMSYHKTLFKDMMLDDEQCSSKQKNEVTTKVLSESLNL